MLELPRSPRGELLDGSEDGLLLFRNVSSSSRKVVSNSLFSLRSMQVGLPAGTKHQAQRREPSAPLYRRLERVKDANEA